MPVSWVTSGTRRGVNQCGTSRSTEMNVTASPSPTTARAPIASGRDVVSASASWPDAISAAPATISDLRPVPVEQQAGGHLCAGVHDDLKHHERRQHGPGWR